MGRTDEPGWWWRAINKERRRSKDFVEFLMERWREDYESSQSPGALRSALEVAFQERRSLPAWLVVGIVNILEEKEQQRPARGKRSHAEKAKAFQVDFLRHSCVKRLRQKGIPWAEVYGDAAKELAGTVAAGSESSIEKSYKKWERLEREDRRDQEEWDSLLG